MVNATANDAEQRFLTWLTEHGARFPKIQWPLLTPNGLRGATAREDIACEEVMISIPQQLIISEATCWSDPQLGRVFNENRDVFTRDDPIIALFLMRELVRGDDSFFAPYLAVLPAIDTVQDWSDAERAELHDPSLVAAANRRADDIVVYYNRVMRRLTERYPTEFPSNEYTLARFRFAWQSIQARAFGRRLPWTALVPFADCLNHANVATKYDYNVNENGCFQLFPSGTTTFPRGTEVFNSYGRRPNFQLLLDYGFALEHNEWDYVDVDVPPNAVCLSGSALGPHKKHTPFGRKKLRLDCETTLGMLLPRGLVLVSSLQSLEDEGTVHLVITRESRCDVLTWFKSILLKVLAEFGTSCDADEQHLRQPDLPDRLRLALMYRISRTKIVNRFIGQIDEEFQTLNARDDLSAQAEGGDSNSILAQSALDLRSVHFEDLSIA